MQSLEDVYLVSTVHDKVLINAFCSWNAADPSRGRKFNVLNHGAAAKSKSYSSDIVEEWSVKGVAQCYSYKTLRSDTSNGNFDGSVTIMHELTRTWMGWSDKLKSKMASVGGSEAQEQFKERVTGGIVRIHEMVRDDKTGKRVEKDIVRLSNGTFILNTNDNVYEYSSAILSRFYCQMFRSHARYGREPIDLMSLNETEEQKEKHKRTTLFMNWIHCNIIIVNEMIETGVLAPINTNYSGAMLLRVLHEAGKLGKLYKHINIIITYIHMY